MDCGRFPLAVGLMERIAKLAGGVGSSTKVGMPLSDSEMAVTLVTPLPAGNSLNTSLAVLTLLWRS
jgi:hypothetical protein